MGWRKKSPLLCFRKCRNKAPVSTFLIFQLRFVNNTNYTPLSKLRFTSLRNIALLHPFNHCFRRISFFELQHYKNRYEIFFWMKKITILNLFYFLFLYISLWVKTQTKGTCFQEQNSNFIMWSYSGIFGCIIHKSYKEIRLSFNKLYFLSYFHNLLLNMSNWLS